MRVDASVGQLTRADEQCILQLFAMPHVTVIIKGAISTSDAAYATLHVLAATLCLLPLTLSLVRLSYTATCTAVATCATVSTPGCMNEQR